MKKILVIAFLIFSNFCLAEEKEQKKTPPLGNCDYNTDNKIYNCEAFKCKMPVISAGTMNRIMEITGRENGLCIFNYKVEVRHPQFQATDFRYACKLSADGALEMANQFTEYKKGNIDIYNNPPYSEVLNKECLIQLK